jgi:hypothetical protein
MDDAAPAVSADFQRLYRSRYCKLRPMPFNTGSHADDSHIGGELAFASPQSRQIVRMRLGLPEPATGVVAHISGSACGQMDIGGYPS